MRQLPRRPGLLRGGDADAARHRRRGRGPAVHHAPQRPGHRSVPAHRPGTASEEAAGRRHREGLRDRPGVSQRGHQPAAQSRIHHDGAVPGVRRLPRDDGPDRRADRGLRRCPGPGLASCPTATTPSTSRRPGSALAYAEVFHRSRRRGTWRQGRELFQVRRRGHGRRAGPQRAAASRLDAQGITTCWSIICSRKGRGQAGRAGVRPRLPGRRCVR